MNAAGTHLNLVFAWTWMLAGMISGMMMGLKFRDENWLGGYSSFKRRMYRLGHISFFGLGGLNLLFHLSFADTELSRFGYAASRAFIIGGIAMPLCCWLMAKNPKLHPLFAVPVLSLISAAILTLLQISL
jgi:hypothetical protein